MALCAETCTTEIKTIHTPVGSVNSYLFVPAETLESIENPSRDHIYILPDNSLWILSYDSKGYAQLTSASETTV